MASIGLETYRVVQDFTAHEGDYVVVVNSLCVGVDGGIHKGPATARTVNGRAPGTRFSRAAADQPATDDVMQFIRDRITAHESFNTHTVSKRMGLGEGKHGNVSNAIMRLRDAGEIVKVPNGGSHGPYVKALRAAPTT